MQTNPLPPLSSHLIAWDLLGVVADYYCNKLFGRKGALIGFVYFIARRGQTWRNQTQPGTYGEESRDDKHVNIASQSHEIDVDYVLWDNWDNVG